MNNNTFSIEGIAEAIRFLLCYGEIEFTDEAFSINDWPEIENNFSVVGEPIPTTDENKRHAIQSLAIVKHLGKLFNLEGKNETECMEIEATVMLVNALRMHVRVYKLEENSIQKLEKRQRLLETTLPKCLNQLETIVKENNGFMALGKLTWSDFYFASYIAYLDSLLDTDDFLATYPNLTQLRQKIGQIPQIQKWAAQRAPLLAQITNNKYKLA